MIERMDYKKRNTMKLVHNKKIKEFSGIIMNNICGRMKAESKKLMGGNILKIIIN